MRQIGIIAFMLFVLWKLTAGSDMVALAPGIKAPDTPRQQTIKEAKSFSFKHVSVTPLADFSMQGKVLAKENYYLGEESDISPVDLALGWGKMSDQAIIDKIQFSQSGRWYRWSVDTFPIPRKEISRQSANMHMIPSADWIATKLDRVKQGQIIALEGFLVRIDAKEKNWHWQSSLTREDSGAGACELIYLTGFQIVE